MSLSNLAEGLGLSVGPAIETRGGDGASATQFVVPGTREGREALYQELTQKREALYAEADKIGESTKEQRAVDPEAEARFNTIEAEVRDLSSRLLALEEAMKADMADDVAEAETVDRFVARIQSIRTKPARVQRRSSQIPAGSFGIVRDVNDKRFKRNVAKSLFGWFAPESVTDETRTAADEIGFDLNTKKLAIRLFESEAERELRADMSTSAGYGGNTIATVLTDYIQIALKDHAPLLDVARVFRTAQGNPLKLPTIDDTGTDGALGTEGSAPSASEITDSSKTFNSYRVERLIKVSNELLRDTNFGDLPQVIGQLLGESVGRKISGYVATGTGSSQPEGIVTGSAAGLTAASATAITMNELIRLIYTVDTAYHQGSMFFMNPSVWSSLLQLQDAFGRPLIGDFTDMSRPMIKGFPVKLVPGMAASIATTAKTVLFGNPKYFGIRLVGDLEVVRFNELYGAAYQTGFMAVQFMDSKVTLSGAIKRITQA